MKYALILLLTFSLSSLTYAYETEVSRTSAPSSDEPSFTNVKEKEAADPEYYNTDSVRGGQSATKRDYQYDSNIKMCRTMNGIWLTTGDRGYAACMDSSQTLKKQ